MCTALSFYSRSFQALMLFVAWFFLTWRNQSPDKDLYYIYVCFGFFLLETSTEIIMINTWMKGWPKSELTVPGRGYGMRPWKATHWKLGPSLWAKGPLKTVRMSAMLYTHTAEPLNTELRTWDGYFQWEPAALMTSTLTLLRYSALKVVTATDASYPLPPPPSIIWCGLAQSLKTTTA